MSESHIPIGQVKRDISDLVNRVAYGGERIVLTSRGKPKAALVGMEDYERLAQEQQRQELARWLAWQKDCEQLATDILQRRGDRPLDVDTLWELVRAAREARDDQIIGR